MDLLLTHGYFLHEDAKELQIMKPYVPLGLLYLSSHLRAQGFAVEIYDSTFGERADLIALLRNGPPAVLGVYANLMTRPSVVRILAEARRCGWITVAGGPEPGVYAAEYLDAGADVVVVGEGELTVQELLPALRALAKPRTSDGRMDLSSLPGIRGIAYRALDGSLCRTPPRPLIPDLDAQPWPDRDRVPVERYLAAWRHHHGLGSVSIITARGCPYSCRWCSHAVYGRTHRRRGPVAVVDEVEWLLQRYAPEMLWIADDVFTIHHAWLHRYAEEMKRRGLRIPFECISRADRLNPEVLDRLAELGCFRLWIGSESGSQQILDAMQRGVTVEQVQVATHQAQARGIQVGMFLMWGYSGEEVADIEATVAHVKRSAPDVFLTTISYPIKGTPYFEDVQDRTLGVAEWATGSDRQLGIRGRHSRRFYASADRLLRSEAQLGRLSADADCRADLEAEIHSARADLHRYAMERET